MMRFTGIFKQMQPMMVLMIVGRGNKERRDVMKLVREVMRGERDESAIAILVAFYVLAEGMFIAILFALKFIINLF